MTKKEKVINILEILNEKFGKPECALKYNTPFELLVAVILSAQCTDVRVNIVTSEMYKKVNTPEQFANLPVEEIEEMIKSTGFYRNKAKNIKLCSQQLLNEYNGEIPQEMDKLVKLAGVGRKTANVVRSVAFDIPSFAVDTHVNRVSKRLGLAKYNDSVEKVEEKLKRKIDRSRWNQGHHDFIFFGRYLCHSRNPECERCPFKSFCKKDKYEK